MLEPSRVTADPGTRHLTEPKSAHLTGSRAWSHLLLDGNHCCRERFQTWLTYAILLPLSSLWYEKLVDRTGGEDNFCNYESTVSILTILTLVTAILLVFMQMTHGIAVNFCRLS